MTITDQELDSGNRNPWALVLAAGEGSRLRSLTTTVGGLTVPKQFCSLHGGASLLEEALTRGESVARPDRIAVVVAAQHRRWWADSLRSLAPNNVIAQPDNKGTAVGLLLPLVHIVRRDPDAIVVVLPADHFVRDEEILAARLRQAAQLARTDHRRVNLLGLAPERPDPELGYIVPDGRFALGAGSVRRFVEKPTADLAQSLVDGGALWNSFILAASARALLGLYETSHAELARAMTEAVQQDASRTADSPAVHRLYAALPALDFSRDVLEGQEALLRVVRVPNCGWSDLGTPQRVAETLRCHRPATRSVPRRLQSSHLSLAEEHHRRQHAL